MQGQQQEEELDLDLKSFALVLSRLRKAKGLTQEQLAEQIGKSLQWVRLLEQAKFPVGQIADLARLAKVLDTSVLELFAAYFSNEKTILLIPASLEVSDRMMLNTMGQALSAWRGVQTGTDAEMESRELLDQLTSVPPATDSKLKKA
jgi:transcriptional regulator with XRE-family HTH domain